MREVGHFHAQVGHASEQAGVIRAGDTAAAFGNPCFGSLSEYESWNRSENAAGDDIPFDFGEPDLDLVQPGGVGRREVQPYLRMRF